MLVPAPELALEYGPWRVIHEIRQALGLAD
jgi:hypothetical protein